ncbi:hypothetical protein WAI78_21830, partial [Acinetobacter baumannii]
KSLRLFDDVFEETAQLVQIVTRFGWQIAAGEIDAELPKPFDARPRAVEQLSGESEIELLGPFATRSAQIERFVEQNLGAGVVAT